MQNIICLSFDYGVKYDMGFDEIYPNKDKK